VLDAGLDDYLDLVGCHRHNLPVVALDPNPYWMGFYASRPEAKRRCQRIVRKLVIAEKLSVLPARSDSPAGESQVQRDVRKAWDLAVLSNHHDFITGTSPDRVWLAEQQPWLEQAEKLADDALARIRALRPPARTTARSVPPRFRLEGGELTVETDDYRIVLSERAGGCITSVRLRGSTEELIAGPANDLVSYHDTGGLWRMGHEFRGGAFVERTRASLLPARIRVDALDQALEVSVDSELDGRSVCRRLWLRNGSPVLRMRLSGSAEGHRTVTCRFPTLLLAPTLSMDVPGGIVERPAHKLYSPTFWPARSFVHLHDPRSGRGLAAFLGGPAAASSDGAGTLQWIALRHAPREMAFGFLPILAHPASGTDPREGQLDYAVWFTIAGDARYNGLPHHVRRALRAAMFGADEPDLDDLANSVVVVDRGDVKVTALKPPLHGDGVIVRLSSFARSPVEVRLSCRTRPIRLATLCDARERPIRGLQVDGGFALVPMPYALASVHVSFGEP
jgi:alpha-mannosidase